MGISNVVAQCCAVCMNVVSFMNYELNSKATRYRNYYPRHAICMIRVGVGKMISLPYLLSISMLFIIRTMKNGGCLLYIDFCCIPLGT